MEFSGDGTRLATLDEAGVAKLWDVASGRLLRNIVEDGRTSSDADEFLCFSADGSAMLLLTPTMGTILYDGSTGRRLAQCPGRHLLAATVTERGILAAIPERHGVELVDVASGEVRSHLEWPGGGHSFYGRPALSADGKLVAAPSINSRMIVWDVDSGEAVRNYAIPVNDDSVEPVFSRDGRRLGFHSFYDPIYVIDLETGEFFGPFGGPGTAERFWLDETGERLAAFLGTYVTVWEIRSGRILHDTRGGPERDEPSESEGLETRSLEGSGEEGHPEEGAICFRAGGEILFAWSEGNEVYLDDLTSGARRWRAAPPPTCPFGYRLAVAPSGSALARNSSEMVEAEHDLLQHFSLWNLAELRPTFTLEAEGQGVVGLATHPDGETFVYADDTGLVRRRWADAKLAWELELDVSRVTDLAVSPDGETVLFVESTGEPRALDLNTGSRELKFRQGVLNTILSGFSKIRWADPFGGVARSIAPEQFGLLPEQRLAVSAAHNLLVTAGRHSGLRLWDLSNGKCAGARSLRGQDCTAMAASADGQFLALGVGGEARIYRMPDLVRLGALSGHTNAVRTLAFSADSRLLASGARDSTVRLWEMPAGTPREPLRGHCGPVDAVAFVPGRRALVSAGVDSTFRFWDVATGRLLLTVFDPEPMAYLALTPDGHYSGTPRMETYLAFSVTEGGECRSLSVEEYEREFSEGRRKERLSLYSSE